LVVVLQMALLQVLVGDWLLLQELVSKGLTLVAVVRVLQLLVLVGRRLLLVDSGLQLIVMVGGQMLPLMGRDLRLLILLIVLLQMCSTL
jgi:hypothetical protein